MQSGSPPAVNCTFTPPIHLSTCFSEAIALLLLIMRRPIFAPVTPECARSSVRNTAQFLTHLLDVAVGWTGFLLCIRRVQGSYLGSEIDLCVLARSQIAKCDY
jgi:hypothetical protein